MRERNSFNVLKDKLSDEDVNQIHELITERCKLETCNKIFDRLSRTPNLVPFAGILERLVKENGKWRYIAGQSYPDEIRVIRNIIKNGRV